MQPAETAEASKSSFFMVFPFEFSKLDSWHQKCLMNAAFEDAKPSLFQSLLASGAFSILTFLNCEPPHDMRRPGICYWERTVIV